MSQLDLISVQIEKINALSSKQKQLIDQAMQLEASIQRLRRELFAMIDMYQDEGVQRDE